MKLSPGACRALALALCLVAGGRAFADEACSALPAVPETLAPFEDVRDYAPTLQLCRREGQAESVALRRMTLASGPALLLADPRTLATHIDKAACWTCEPMEESALETTRMGRAVAKSAEAPGLEKRGFLENAGLTHGQEPGSYLTGDLCPSSRRLDRRFLSSLAPHTQIALSISGLWLTHHFDDYRWLVERQAAGAFDIVWTDHSYHHPFKRGVAYDRNFLLTPGVDADAEILDTERLLIANGQTPSLFFRFPGLISSSPLMLSARRLHLISLGADAWLANGQKPEPGSILLVHPNGNEPLGLKLFERDFASGRIAEPLRPLTEAP